MRLAPAHATKFSSLAISTIRDYLSSMDEMIIFTKCSSTVPQFDLDGAATSGLTPPPPVMWGETRGTFRTRTGSGMSGCDSVQRNFRWNFHRAPLIAASLDPKSLRDKGMMAFKRPPRAYVRKLLARSGEDHGKSRRMAVKEISI